MRQPGRIARTFIAATCATLALAAASAGGAGITVLRSSPATPDNLSSQQWNLDMIGAFQAQTITGGSPDVRVALIDSGIDPEHPEFAGRIDTANSVSCITGTPVNDPTGALWRDNVGHGTHVAGLIAAGDNDFGTVGVAPNVQLLIVKVTDPGLPITPQAAACAFKYVSQQNVDVANASFAVDKGATGAADPLDFFCAADPSDAEAIQAVGGAVKAALRSGTTIVASAGNNGIDMTQPAGGPSCIRMPVQLPGVIGVASEGRNGGPVLATPPGPSNFGFGAIDLVAPGGDPAQGGVPNGLVLSTFPTYIPIPPTAMPNVVDGPGATYRYNAGTSMAAAQVSGVAALVSSRFAKLNSFRFLKPLKPLFIRALLDRTAQEKPCPADPRCVGTADYNGFFGFGQVDANAAVTAFGFDD
ncbi:MAG TPA: S8 family serine peptidase [Gaiellaceae bacterium]|nr:S8 family serine peptidase [Gaiellaceae bacterium]